MSETTATSESTASQQFSTLKFILSFVEFHFKLIVITKLF